MITRSMDPLGDFIVVTARGEWTASDVAQHYAELREMIASVRAGGQRVRILSDVRQAVRQPPEIERLIEAEMRATFQPGDRMAIVTGTPADQRYLRERLQGRDAVAFNSRLAAEIWLASDGPPPRSRAPWG